MNITELDSYNLDDAVKFNDHLNPRLWDDREHLRPEVRERLLEIAEDFKTFLGLRDLDIKDITVSGSNAAYTYTPNSDIDLHIVADVPEDEVYRELFDAKKGQYNDQHNITIGGNDVELYVETAGKPPISQGMYSVLNNNWIQVPRRVKANVDDVSTRNKFESVGRSIERAVRSGDLKRMDRLAKKIKRMRQTGLENHGEFGPENLAFKMLRSQGKIKELYDARNAAKDQLLSLKERKRPGSIFTYGFKHEESVEPKIAEAESASMPTDEDILKDFIKFCVAELKIKQMPTIKLRRDPQWPVMHTTFGRYTNDRHLLEVAWGSRHIMDVLRTVAHELTHKHQHERDGTRMDSTAGETGSPWENEANARAGILMRDYARMHPDYFAVGQAKDLHADEVKESASGYIPTKKQARDPRYSMALTVDIKPGQVGKEANKLKLKTDSQGHPQIANPNGLVEQLMLEYHSSKEKKIFALAEEQDLFEIKMSTSSLRQEAAKTGAIAGMEFEMIVPNVEGSDDGDLEPDYDMDERCRSIQDAYDFFYDGDFNGRRECERLVEKMREDYWEWLDEKIADEWERNGDDYITDWVKNNVDESEWNPDELEGDARNEALEEYSANVHADPSGREYQDAYDEFREENQESYDESDWLDDADLSRMSEIENNYSMSWPHWRSQGSGESSIEDVASEFENAIGRDVRASGSYHSGSTLRPSPTQIRYVVEPDGSLEPDHAGEQGLEFVSPPLPIDEILGDLNKVKAWAKEYGCYTNDSTGLHINISVPDYSRQNLDFVKLALLMGDKYVLDAFGRSSNTYAKSAFDIVKKAVRDQPEEAAKLLDKMKGNLDQLATKAIHSGITSKYTSINTKDGHIEFRSPGGDWLNENFDKIETTLLRFTVAMSAALNPDMYRQEYLTKLYKLLSDGNKDIDTIKYFSDYVAGKIPKAALRSFVKQAQLQRQVKRGKTDGQKMWWKVYKEGKAARNGAAIEVVATSEDEAKQKAAKEWGEPLLVNTLARMDAEAVRPYTDTADQDNSANPLRPTGPGPWEVYNRQTGNSTINLVQGGRPITDRAQAQQLAMNLIVPERHDLYGVRTIGTEQNDIPEVPLDIEQNFPQDRTDGRNIDYSFRDLFGTTDQASSAPAGNSFSGQWKVLDANGNELWTFRGVGNNQADANRLALRWLIDNGYGHGTEISVVPVMIESMAESRIIDPERVDVYYRPVMGSRGRRVVARNIPVAALDALLQKLSDKYGVPVESFEWTPTRFVDENFADGKGPGRPGDSQRHGIPKHATMAELEKASHAKGRKGQLARWQLNMRRGKARSK